MALETKPADGDSLDVLDARLQHALTASKLTIEACMAREAWVIDALRRAGRTGDSHLDRETSLRRASLETNLIACEMEHRRGQTEPTEPLEPVVHAVCTATTVEDLQVSLRDVFGDVSSSRHTFALDDTMLAERRGRTAELRRTLKQTRTQNVKDVERDIFVVGPDKIAIRGPEAKYEGVVSMISTELTRAISALHDEGDGDLNKMNDEEERVYHTFVRCVLDAACRSSTAGDALELVQSLIDGGETRDLVVASPDTSSSEPLRIEFDLGAFRRRLRSPAADSSSWDFGVVCHVRAVARYAIYSQTDVDFVSPVFRLEVAVHRDLGLSLPARFPEAVNDEEELGVGDFDLGGVISLSTC